MKKYWLLASLLLILFPLAGISLGSDCATGSCAVSAHPGPCLEGTPVSKEMPRAEDYFITFNLPSPRTPGQIVLDIFVPPS